MLSIRPNKRSSTTELVSISLFTFSAMSVMVPEVKRRTSCRMSCRIGNSEPTLSMISPMATGSRTFLISSPVLSTRMSLRCPFTSA